MKYILNTIFLNIAAYCLESIPQYCCIFLRKYKHKIWPHPLPNEQILKQQYMNNVNS